jgi:hypothetical protein
MSLLFCLLLLSSRPTVTSTIILLLDNKPKLCCKFVLACDVEVLQCRLAIQFCAIGNVLAMIELVAEHTDAVLNLLPFKQEQLMTTPRVFIFHFCFAISACIFAFAKSRIASATFLAPPEVVIVLLLSVGEGLLELL